LRRVRIAPQPSNIRADFRGVLVTQVKVFLQALTDDFSSSGGRSRFNLTGGIAARFRMESKTTPVVSPRKGSVPETNATTGNFGCKIFLLGFTATVLTFLTGGFLFICVLRTPITWERTPPPVRRPAFSSQLVTTTEYSPFDSATPDSESSSGFLAGGGSLRKHAKAKSRP